jgi:hypothetical protein
VLATDSPLAARNTEVKYADAVFGCIDLCKELTAKRNDLLASKVTKIG